MLYALKSGELDLYEYAVVSFLLDEIDHSHKWIESIALTLRGLAEAIDWPLSQEALRQRLHNLRDAGWIDFDQVKRGQQKPWIVRLGRAAIDGDVQPTSKEPPRDLQPEGASSLEVRSNETRSQEAATPDATPDSTDIRPQPVGGLREEKRREEHARRLTPTRGGDALSRTPRTDEPETIAPWIADFLAQLREAAEE